MALFRVPREPNMMARWLDRAIWSFILIGFLAISLPGISLGDVTWYEIDDLGDASAIQTGVRQGMEQFSQLYPDLARRNHAWLATAELSVGGSHAIDDDEDRYYLRLDLAHGEEEDSFRFDVDPRGISARDYAEALRNLVVQVEGFPRVSGSVPQLVRRFALDAFQTDVAPAAISPATGITVLPDGRIILGHGATSTIVDPRLRQLGSVAAGLKLLSSPSGTILSLVPDSAELLVFNPPEPEPRSIDTGIATIQSLAWLSDGTLVVKEGRIPRVIAIEADRRRELRLAEFSSRTESCFLAAGPDATFYSFNPVRKYLTWYDKTGRILDRHLPCLAEDQFKQIRSIISLRDGSLLFRGSNFLTRLGARGDLIWSLPLDPALGDQLLDAAWSELEQSVYVILPGSRTVLQFMEAKTLAGKPAVSGVDYRALADLDARLRRAAPGDNPLRQTADWYLAAGASDYALSLYQAATRQNPGDANLKKLVASLRAAQLLAAAGLIDARVRTTLRDIGPESARADYSAAISRYEQALALKPGDAAIQQARASLAKALRDAEAGLVDPVPPLSLEEGELAPIFPALLATYRNQPVTSIKIRNGTGQTAGQVRASLFIPRFMDYPTEAKVVASLVKDEELTIPLFASFNQQPLEVEEELPIQARIHVEWTIQGQTYSLDRSLAGLMKRRSALTWDDSGKLAAFITPNEDTVNQLAMKLVAVGNQNATAAAAPRLAAFSARLARVSAIVEGLAAYRLQYLEDPQSALSVLMGKPLAVDTVRFPRTTLLYRNGDCDDLTALLASLLEAAGIPTAVMTTPGHVFLAFDCGLSPDRAWIVEAAGSVINSQGNVWIPLESTALDKGLAGAWNEAAELVRRWKGTAEYAFLPVAGLRVKYPAAALPAQMLNLEMPDIVALEKTIRSREQGLLDKLYRGNVRSFAQAKPEASEEALRLNRLGVLQASFGEQSLALESFAAALRAKVDYFPATINLANACLLAGQLAQAASWLERARMLRPESSALSALEARISQLRQSAGVANGALAQVDPKIGSDAGVSERAANLAWQPDWLEQ